MENTKKSFMIALILLVISIVFTILVTKVDVKPIGPVNPETNVISEVGFASINGAFHDKLGFNDTFYTVSKYAGYLALVLVVFYAFTGLIELLQKKSLKEVNKALYALAAFYVCVAVVYVLFEVMIINYRPVIMDGELEASFPSSHTLLALCVCGSSLIVSKYIVKKENFRKLLNIGSWIVMILVVVTRVLSGVHWITDICGGILISLFMLETLSGVVKCIAAKKQEN